MKLTEYVKQADEFRAKGYELPVYDRAAMIANTKKNPVWIHFGAGNIFRAFPAAFLEEVKECYEMNSKIPWRKINAEIDKLNGIKKDFE